MEEGGGVTKTNGFNLGLIEQIGSKKRWCAANAVRTAAGGLLIII